MSLWFLESSGLNSFHRRRKFSVVMSGNNLHLLEAPNYQLDKCSRKRTELLESFSIAFI